MVLSKSSHPSYLNPTNDSSAELMAKARKALLEQHTNSVASSDSNSTSSRSAAFKELVNNILQERHTNFIPPSDSNSAANPSVELIAKISKTIVEQHTNTSTALGTSPSDDTTLSELGKRLNALIVGHKF